MKTARSTEFSPRRATSIPTPAFNGAVNLVFGALQVTTENLDISGTGDPAFGGGALVNIDGNNTWGGPLTLAGVPNNTFTTVTGLASTAQLVVGDVVSGAGIPLGDTITQILSQIGRAHV